MNKYDDAHRIKGKIVEYDYNLQSTYEGITNIVITQNNTPLITLPASETDRFLQQVDILANGKVWANIGSPLVQMYLMQEALKAFSHISKQEKTSKKVGEV